MILANYINDLLYRYDCVIVPDFGGFITNKIGAKINNYTHTFYPPTKQISFNTHLKHNDGLLANYIASCENISFDLANETIEKEVAVWKKELETSSVTISGVGTLVSNDEKQIVFEPNTSTNYLTSSFGLSSVNQLEIQRFKQEVKPLNPIVEVSKDEQTKSIPAFIKYAATAAILLTLGATTYNKFNDYREQQIFAKQQQEVEQKIQQATFVIDTPLPTINLDFSKETKKVYHVIAGAFKLEENATKKLVELKSKGYNATILGKNKWGLTQVSFGSYDNDQQARRVLGTIRKTQSTEAWLLVKNAD